MKRQRFVRSSILALSSALLAKPPAAFRRDAAQSGRQARPRHVQVPFRRRIHRHSNRRRPPLFFAVLPAGHHHRRAVPPVGRSPLCLDHWLVASLRISRAGFAPGPPPHGAGHRPGRHRVARHPLQLADRDDGRLHDFRRHLPLTLARCPLRPHHHRSQDD